MQYYNRTIIVRNTKVVNITNALYRYKIIFYNYKIRFFFNTYIKDHKNLTFDVM